MKTEDQLRDEARALLENFQFVPEIGAMCRGGDLRVWFTFRRFGRSRAGEIAVRTQPPLPDAHFRLMQPCPAGENVREAFTDATGSTLLEYVLGDVPCAVRVIARAEERKIVEPQTLDPSLAETEASPDRKALPLSAAPHSDLALAAQGGASESGAENEAFEPRSWEWKQPALSICVADIGLGGLSMAIETQDQALAGKTVRVDFAGAVIEVKIDLLPESPGFIGGVAPVPLSPTIAKVGQLTRVEAPTPK